MAHENAESADLESRIVVQAALLIMALLVLITLWQTIGWEPDVRVADRPSTVVASNAGGRE